MRSKPSTEPRKRPRQERARETVAAMLEAAARILSEEGFDAVTTNRIAERAGVSVGSLYQYFPSREALVAAMIEHRLERELVAFDRALEALAALPLRAALARLVRATLRHHLDQRAFYEAVLPNVPHVERERATRDATARAAERFGRFLAARSGELARPHPERAAFVALRALEAVAHATVLERRPLLDPERMEEELAALLVGYLCRDGAAEASA